MLTQEVKQHFPGYILLLKKSWVSTTEDQGHLSYCKPSLSKMNAGCTLHNWLALLHLLGENEWGKPLVIGIRHRQQLPMLFINYFGNYWWSISHRFPPPLIKLFAFNSSKTGIKSIQRTFPITELLCLEKLLHLWNFCMSGRCQRHRRLS